MYLTKNKDSVFRKKLLIILAIACSQEALGAYPSAQSSPTARIKLLRQKKEELANKLAKLSAEQGRLTLLIRTLQKGSSPQEKVAFEPLVNKLKKTAAESAETKSKITAIEAELSQEINQLKTNYEKST